MYVRKAFVYFNLLIRNTFLKHGFLKVLQKRISKDIFGKQNFTNPYHA